MKYKRILALVLAAAALLGLLAGCGKQEEASQPAVESATGRYVEQSIPLPGSGRARDMVMLSDGRLRVALDTAEGILVATSSSGGEQWEEQKLLPQEVFPDPERFILESMALSPDGTVFCAVMEYLEDGTPRPHLWVMDPDGTARELPNTYPKLDPELGFFIQNCDFTQDGKLMVGVYVKELRQLDTVTGAFGDDLNSTDSTIFRLGCGGSGTYLLGMETGSVCIDGEIQMLPQTLKEHVEQSLKKDYGNTPKLTFWENEEGYLFYTTAEGIFSYVPGGGVVEQLVDAARTSQGDPTCLPVALTGAADGTFYLLANAESGPALYRYRYDEQAATSGSVHLRVYSLYEDDDLRQMISKFQGSHPEIAVDLEIGLSGQDGRTQADAINALNTEILAGSGPDLLCLDGLNVDTYLEKGVLADVRGVLDQAGPTLDQVTRCYGQGDKVCAVPTTFTIPAMYGPEQYLSQIHDLDSLVDAAQQAREDHPEKPWIIFGLHPALMGDLLYDSCSAAWLREDGTLDPEKLTQYYAAMQKLYALDDAARKEHPEWVSQVDEQWETERPAGAYTALGGVRDVVMEVNYLCAGTLEGMMNWSMVLAGEREHLGDGYATIPLDGQASHVFLPKRIMGILSTSANIPAAESFLSYMLSPEVQQKNLSYGFPVNQAVFQGQMEEERELDMTLSMSSVDSDEVLEFTLRWPEKPLRQQLETWVENLTTPALTDRTIRSIVMAQITDCCNGVTTPEGAAQAALKELNLYLSE